MTSPATIPPDFFEQHYLASPDADPFHYAENRFEIRKYAIQRSLLGESRYVRGLELGCSIGIFTRMAAEVCDELIALDCSAKAIEVATEHCADLPNVHCRVGDLPADFPLGPFDLVCMAEVGYYLDAEDLATLRDDIARETIPGATILLTHMTIDFKTYMGQPIPSSGADVHAAFRDDDRFRNVSRLRGYDIAGDPDFSHPELYVCDLFERTAR